MDCFTNIFLDKFIKQPIFKKKHYKYLVESELIIHIEKLITNNFNVNKLSKICLTKVLTVKSKL